MPSRKYLGKRWKPSFIFLCPTLCNINPNTRSISLGTSAHQQADDCLLLSGDIQAPVFIIEYPCTWEICILSDGKYATSENWLHMSAYAPHFYKLVCIKLHNMHDLEWGEIHDFSSNLSFLQIFNLECISCWNQQRQNAAIFSFHVY